MSLITAESDTLIVGTNAEYAPFTYMENGEIVGFDIDISKEIAHRLGKKIQFKNMPFDALIPDVLLGHVDFAAAGMSYTEERSKRVLFTKNYLAEDPLVIFSFVKQNIHSEEDLTNKNVVVIEGFSSDLYMSSKKNINLIRLPSQSDGFMAIKSGRADAFITAKSTINAFIEKQNGLLYHSIIIPKTGETCAIIVPKMHPEMLNKIKDTLDAMEADGTLAKIKTKWNLS